MLLFIISIYEMQQEDQIIRKLEIEEAFAGLRKDGIVHVYYKKKL